MSKIKGKAHWAAAMIAAHVATGFVAEAWHEFLVEASIAPVIHVVEHVVAHAEAAMIGGE